MSRSLRKTAHFLTQAHDASQNVPRLLESIAGAEWILVRNPEQGMAVRGTRYSSWPVHPTEGISFKIFYFFNEREVVLDGLYTAVAPSGR
ncbi:MAG TPA: hypothetical protein VGP73_23950 [Thermoanaerobaculia bacterium]